MPKARWYVQSDSMPAELKRVTDAVIHATTGVQATLRHRPPDESALDAFWCLQDRVHQLLAHIRDHPWKITMLRETHPDLARTVVEVLSRARKSPFFQKAAIQQACTTINDSLMELQWIKDKKQYSRPGNGS